jgi:hypothetical protein
MTNTVAVPLTECASLDIHPTDSTPTSVPLLCYQLRIPNLDVRGEVCDGGDDVTVDSCYIGGRN